MEDDAYLEGWGHFVSSLPCPGMYVVHSGWEMSVPETDKGMDPNPDVMYSCITGFIDSARRSLEEYDLPIIEPKGPYFGMEVGDDRVTVSQSTLDLALIHIVQEKVYQMRTSKEDTFISKKWYNLAEVTSLIPRSRMGSFDHARKTGRQFAELEFVDDAALRVLINVTKGDKAAHASTVVGKTQYLRSRIRSRPEVQGKMDISNFLQDGILITSRSPDPKYIPTGMGGTGHSGLFWNPDNILLYVHSYKNGTCERILGSATEEAMETVKSMDFVDSPSSIPLCWALRMKQQYLHATYDNMVAVPTTIRDTDILPEPLYRALPPGAGAGSVESRLIRTKTLLTRRDAETEFDRKRRVELVLKGFITKPYLDRADKIGLKEMRKSFNGAVTSLSAFKNLVERKAVPQDMDDLMANGFKVVRHGQRHFTRVHSKWIAEGCKGIVYNLADINHSEDMFFREDVSCEESLKVGGIQLLVRGPSGNRVFRETTVKVGLYEIGISQQEWAEHVASQLRIEWAKTNSSINPRVVEQIFYDNREWVTDDTLIIGKCTSDAIRENIPTTSCVLLISSDKKLASKMAHSANIVVARCDPTTFKSFLHKRLYTDQWEEFPIDRLNPLPNYGGRERRPHHIYVDTGSTLAHMSKLEWERDTILKTELIRAGERDGHRTETVRRTIVDLTLRYEYFFARNNKRPSRTPSETSSYERKALSQYDGGSATSERLRNLNEETLATQLMWGFGSGSGSSNEDSETEGQVEIPLY